MASGLCASAGEKSTTSTYQVVNTDWTYLVKVLALEPWLCSDAEVILTAYVTSVRLDRLEGIQKEMNDDCLPRR